MKDDISNTPDFLKVVVLEEEVRHLRMAVGRCSVVSSTIFAGSLQCRLPVVHTGKHRAFGPGGDGHGGIAYWFQEWE